MAEITGSDLVARDYLKDVIENQYIKVRVKSLIESEIQNAADNSLCGRSGAGWNLVKEAVVRVTKKLASGLVAKEIRAMVHSELEEKILRRIQSYACDIHGYDQVSEKIANQVGNEILRKLKTINKELK